jgi:hypothetical protein
VKVVRIAIVASVSGALLVVPAKAGVAGLGGFTLTAEAAPIAIQIFEPAIPIPAEPQLELNLSYSRAKFSSGPTGRGLSSLVWPGDAVGYGLPELLKNPDASYPVKVDAAHPSGPADAKQEIVPGTGMTSHADDKSVEAAAYIAKPALPLLPVPGVPIPSLLVGVESFSSQSKATVSGDKATATSYATAGSITLLGGLVKIDGLRADTEAVSDGSTGTTTGTVVWKSLTLAGQTIAVNQDGVTSPLGVTALPKLPANLTKVMANLGLSVALPKVTWRRSSSSSWAARRARRRRHPRSRPSPRHRRSVFRPAAVPDPARGRPEDPAPGWVARRATRLPRRVTLPHRSPVAGHGPSSPAFPGTSSSSGLGSRRRPRTGCAVMWP